MSLLDFIAKMGERSPRRNVQEVSDGLKRRIAPKKAHGPSVYTQDWDILILLDTCRPDVFEEYAIPFLNQEGIEVSSFETVTSNASQSREWMERTFIDDYCLMVSQTAYVTANVYTAKVFDGMCGRHPFDELVELWRTDWDDTHATVRAENVVQAALPYVGADRPSEKTIVHFMQPHFPSVADPITEQQTPIQPDYTGQSVTFAWNKLQDREISEERVRKSYNENLLYALEEVIELIHQADGKVVLSSDHGQAFGEWGVYGHPPSTRTKEVLEVPWAVVKERDSSPESDANVEEGVDEKLAALGYK
jgi:hypothetical protein